MSLPTPTLHTARLRLRPFDDADANDLFALQSNAYVLRYWDAPPWSERGRAERFITACRQMAEEGTGARLAVDRVSDQTSRRPRARAWPRPIPARHLQHHLVARGLLPPLDRHLVSFEAWLHRRLTTIADHPHERLLRRLALWHQLPRLRADATA